MKSLAVCGDSWFSTDKKYPGCSFGEILRDKHDLNLWSLARSGCSNFGISLQINRAIQLRPDFIIVGCTTADRIEIPIKQQTNLIKTFLDYVKWPDGAKELGRYDRSQGLENVKYSHAVNELSIEFSQPAKETIICEPINNLIWANRDGLDLETISALKEYILHIYDNNIKQQIDCWMMSDAARRLVESRIPFLFYVEPLFYGEFLEDILWLGPKNLVVSNDFSYYNYRIGKPIFHLDTDDAKDFANRWERRLIEQGFLDG